jgi:hypothetical protein
VANGRARKARDRHDLTDDAGAASPARSACRSTSGGSPRRRLADAFGKGVLHVGPTGRARRITGADGLPGPASATCSRIVKATWLAIERAGLVRVRDAWFHTLATDGRATPRWRRCPPIATALRIGPMGDGLQRYRDGALTSRCPTRRLAASSSRSCPMPPAASG